jgi:hypothetical protein
VTIFTPDDTHFEIAMAAVQRGLHVLVTKVQNRSPWHSCPTHAITVAGTAHVSCADDALPLCCLRSRRRPPPPSHPISPFPHGAARCPHPPPPAHTTTRTPATGEDPRRA